MRRFTARRPSTLLSDPEWEALAPYVARASGGPGRPLRDPRARLDAMLRNTLADRPWRDLSEQDGKPDTLSRLFRRWAHAGLWLRLLDALAAPDAPPALRGLEYRLRRLARRGMWTLRRAGRGMAELARIERLGLLAALPMLPWFLPKRDLSETVFRHIDRVLARLPAERPPPGLLGRLGRLLLIAGGRPFWTKRFAPP
jgi:transposase